MILTSEDDDLLQNVEEMLRNDTLSSDHTASFTEWTVIRNVEDVNAGEGTMGYKRSDRALDPLLGTALKFDHTVNSMATVMLQLHLEPEYVQFWDQSSFSKFMWQWAQNLECTTDHEQRSRREERKCIELKSKGSHQNRRRVTDGIDIRFPGDLRQRLGELRQDDATSFFEHYGLSITGQSWDDRCGEGQGHMGE